MKPLIIFSIVLIALIVILFLLYFSNNSRPPLLPFLNFRNKNIPVKTPINKSIIVIGAGISGAIIAKTLKDKGFKVLVLEAKNRVGGRMYNDSSTLSVPIDLGAGWIHQSSGNPITKLVNNFKIPSKVTNYENNQLYNYDGKPIEDSKVDNIYKTIMNKCNSNRRSLKNDISIQDCINQNIQNITNDDKIKLNYAINVNLEHEYGSDVKYMSLKNYDEGEEFKGNDLMILGYDKIVKELLKGIDVQLNKEVTSITYNNKGVSVKTSDNKEYNTDYVAITVSIGVLKSGKIKFNPPLPQTKVNAMKNINMGVLNKLFLEFPKVFWDKNVEVINYISESKGIWNESFNLANVLNKPILVMFSTADLASQMENWPDEQIVNSAMNALKKIYGPNIPNPIKYAITRWNSDPHTLGSYSYSAVGSSQPSDRKQISSPLLNRVFFAGEATSSLYPATVHGAYLSGLDTANSILKIS